MARSPSRSSSACNEIAMGSPIWLAASSHRKGRWFRKKGAFTGATSDSPGVIPAADAGTLFLDEIAEFPLITGESGSGKEVVARAVYQLSARADLIRRICMATPRCRSFISCSPSTAGTTGCVEASAKAKLPSPAYPMRSSAPSWRLGPSARSVAKKLSATALSQQSPVRLMLATIPAVASAVRYSSLA